MSAAEREPIGDADLAEKLVGVGDAAGEALHPSEQRVLDMAARRLREQSASGADATLAGRMLTLRKHSCIAAADAPAGSALEEHCELILRHANAGLEALAALEEVER